jgi:hypothetical protein
MAIIVAVRGDPGTGKTTSIRLAYDMFLRDNPDALRVPFRSWREVTTILTINGVLIGIESKGDLEKFLKKAFEVFAECQIIICACHKSGKTMRAVADFASSHGHRLVWLDKSAPVTDDERDADNAAMAAAIVAAVRAELSNGD